jgi:ATP-dependent Zn protease
MTMSKTKRVDLSEALVKRIQGFAPNLPASVCIEAALLVALQHNAGYIQRALEEAQGVAAPESPEAI